MVSLQKAVRRLSERSKRDHYQRLDELRQRGESNSRGGPSRRFFISRAYFDEISLFIIFLYFALLFSIRFNYTNKTMRKLCYKCNDILANVFQ